MFPEYENRDFRRERGWAQDNDMEFGMFLQHRVPASPPHQSNFIDFLEHEELS